MSADSWSICPRCVRAWNAETEKMREAFSKAYRKKPAEEFLAMRDAIIKRDADHMEHTLAEYSSYDMSEEGMVQFDYSAYCRQCNLEVKIQHTFPKVKL